MNKTIIATALLWGIVFSAGATDIDRGRVRIAWDNLSYQEIDSAKVSNASYAVEHNLYYPRAKHLSDGSILLTFENDHYGWDIYSCKSYDSGKTWTESQLIRHSYPENSTKGADTKVFVNPDFYQLRSGRILLAWQWRYHKGYNDLPNTNMNCGIELCYSDDMGQSWSEPREVYRGRNWEPAFVELPSGEIHMYFTDSQQIRNKTSYAGTSILRSFDGGKTWQGKEMATNKDVEMISRTKWNGRGMDGMATAVLLDDDKGIVVPFETWSGRDVYDLSPNLVRTTLSQDWKCDTAAMRANGGPDFPMKKHVSKDLKGFGPYSCKLDNGQVAVLSNGRVKNDFGVFVVLGDKMGDNFTYVTRAFDNPGAYWGSIDQINDSELLAAATLRNSLGSMPAAGDGTTSLQSKDHGKLILIKGWLNRDRIIAKGKPEVQSLTSFNPKGLWMLGKVAPAKVYADFGYDAKNFYFASYVFDSKLVCYNSPENSDAGGILIHRDGKGTFKVVVDAKGDYTVYKEVGYSYQLLCWEYGKAQVQLDGTLNKQGDTDNGYSALVSLPWELLGGKPKNGEKIAIHQLHYYKTDARMKAGIKFEETEGENSDYPGEWLTITLK